MGETNTLGGGNEHPGLSLRTVGKGEGGYLSSCRSSTGQLDFSVRIVIIFCQEPEYLTDSLFFTKFNSARSCPILGDGHSARRHVLPSVRPYATSFHRSGIDRPHSGQRPSGDEPGLVSNPRLK